VHCSKPTAAEASASEADGGAHAPAGTAAVARPASGLTPALAHPCTLLTEAEVEAALGTKDFAPQESPCKEPVGGGGCTWHIPKGGGFVEVQLNHPSDAEGFDRLMHEMQRVPVAGVGDRAYGEPKYRWGHLDVIKNGQRYMVQVSRGNIATGMAATEQALQETTLALAKIIADRL
jgi:hypothetical protein